MEKIEFEMNQTQYSGEKLENFVPLFGRRSWANVDLYCVCDCNRIKAGENVPPRYTHALLSDIFYIRFSLTVSSHFGFGFIFFSKF